MSAFHAVPSPRLATHPPRRATHEIDLTGEAIRRSVQYLAFRAIGLDLVAKYDPGPGQVPSILARAAEAALKAHQQLIPDLEAVPSPARSAAIAARLDLARQLTEVKAGVTRAPTVALRSAYLDALADFIIETAHRDRGLALDAAD